ncbi:MAG TPA: hypothetical protein VI386_37355 [Candidatus Sulfotelmatobacter sp.]
MITEFGVAATSRTLPTADLKGSGTPEQMKALFQRIGKSPVALPDVAHCEAAGMVPYVPVTRTVNNQGDGSLFGREAFRYEPDTDTYVCPGNKSCYARTPIIKIVTPCRRLRLATAAPVRRSHAALRLRDVAWLATCMKKR